MDFCEISWNLTSYQIYVDSFDTSVNILFANYYIGMQSYLLNYQSWPPGRNTQTHKGASSLDISPIISSSGFQNCKKNGKIWHFPSKLSGRKWKSSQTLTDRVFMVKPVGEKEKVTMKAKERKRWIFMFFLFISEREGERGTNQGKLDQLGKFPLGAVRLLSNFLPVQ